MTGKQKAMIVERLKDKTASNAEVIRRAGYKAKDVHTASQQYLENMRNPEIAKRLANVVDEMEDTLVSDVRQYRTSDDIRQRTLANDTARWIHDKVKGKATQVIQSTSTSVNLNLDLTSITDTTDTNTSHA